MEEQLKHDPIYELIKILNDEGLQILEIGNEYFTVTEFFPADHNTPYHKLLGKHITKVIVTYLHTGLQGQQLAAAVQMIESLPDRDVQYSNLYKFRQFIG